MRLAPLAFLLLPTALSGCTLADRHTAGIIVADASAAAPLVCAALAGAGVIGSACGPIAADVADVARLASDVLASIPAAPPSPAAIAPPPPAGFVHRGVVVALPATHAERVRVGIAAKVGGK